MCAACVAIAQPVPLPPLSFQSGAADLPRAIAPKVELARGIVFDDRYRVPTASWPNADLSFEQAAIRAIVQSLQLRWELAREVYGVAPAASPLSAAPVLIGKETVPIAIVPDPQNVVSSLAGVKPSPKDGVFFAPGDIRPKITGGFSGITIYIPRTGAGQVSGPLTPRMQGVPPSAVPISPIKGKEPDVLGRVVSRYGVMGADQLGIYDDIIAQASTTMITRSIWYYRLEVANPHKGKRRGGRIGVLDDATVFNDWCFPIMDANGQARGPDDVRKAERSSPYENLVTTKLLDFPIKGQQAPIVLPTAWYSSHDTMSAEYKAIFDAYEGTETIVLPQRLIDAAGGVVIVRKAESWRPLAQDVVIDADTKNHTGILGVYVSQIVTDDRLIDALVELCGKAPPTGAARAALLESVSKARARE